MEVTYPALQNFIPYRWHHGGRQNYSLSVSEISTAPQCFSGRRTGAGMQILSWSQRKPDRWFSTTSVICSTTFSTALPMKTSYSAGSCMSRKSSIISSLIWIFKTVLYTPSPSSAMPIPCTAVSRKISMQDSVPPTFWKEAPRDFLYIIIFVQFRSTPPTEQWKKLQKKSAALEKRPYLTKKFSIFVHASRIHMSLGASVLYAILRRKSTESHFCVQLQEHLRPHETRNGNILQICTQSCKETLQNLDFAYNFKSISVPAKLEMEISYRFIRNPTKKLYRISLLRTTSRASPSPQGLKWKNFTELYAILRRSSTESHFCVQLQEHLRPHETGNGNILQIYTQSCEEALLNLTFAYNFKSISVPTRLEMEISYRFIRNLAKRLY